MNLHLFPADNRLFVPKFVQTIRDSSYGQSNLMMCYVQEMVISGAVLPLATNELVLSTINSNSVNRVIFHSLQPQAFPLIETVKKQIPKCRVDWIYWGETYDYPSLLMGEKTLIKYIEERGLARWLSIAVVEIGLAQFILNFRASKRRSKIAQMIKNIDTFYHWSQIDYEHIKKIFEHDRLKYQKFFYDVFSSPTSDNYIVERELGCEASNCIVLGHSVSLRNNHLDVLPVVSEYAIKQNKVVICPLSYGTSGKKYVHTITEYMANEPKLSYRIISKFYPEKEYFTFLSRCGAYVAPGRGSLGAGNMIGYVLSGRVPVVDHWNTTGEFLKSIGADVAIYNDVRDIEDLLEDYFGAYSEKNKLITSDYFSNTNKLKCFQNLMATL